MTNDDDAYGRMQCGIWKHHNVHLLFSDSASLLLGLSRLFAFFLLFALNWYNRRLLRSKAQDNMNVVPGLVLPYYFTYIYLYIGFSLFTGILDILLQSSMSSKERVDNWILPIEQGIFHWIYEGLAFFLMRYGAGIKAFQRALIYSGIWGACSFFIYFITFSLYRESYGFTGTNADAFVVYLLYCLALLFFYATMIFAPVSWLYRRSALIFYAKFNVFMYSFIIFVLCIFYRHVDEVNCACSVLIFIIVAFIQPLVLFRTLQIDSQYWQGLKPEKGNPLAVVWDHVDLATAQSMAENLETVNQHRVPLPVLHYGLLDFDDNDHYVAGGFSRVYFGKLRDKPVAFKILFAMELTPDDVTDFYEEATLLYSLCHENVVECKGICVMPPALTMVLEHCKFGSLYDFIYKPLRDTNRNRDSIMSTSSLSIISSSQANTTSTPSTSTARLSLLSNKYFFGGVPGNSVNATHNNTSAVVIAGQSTRPSESGDKIELVSNPMMSRNQSVATESGQNDSISNPSHSQSVNKVASTSSDVRPINIGGTGNKSRRQRNSTGAIDMESGSVAKNPWMLSQTERTISSSSSRASTSVLESRNRDKKSVDHTAEDDDRGSWSHNGRLSTVYKTYDLLANMISRKDNTSGRQPAPARTAAQEVSFETRLRMMRDATNAICFLHSRGYMHCDIKSLNFLVDENYRVKLADMGEVRPIHTDKVYALPPIPARNWAPPEVVAPVVKAEHYTTKSEVYGLSIVLVELITLELPFGELPERLNPKQWYEKLVDENFRPSLPPSLNEKLADVVERGMDTEPSLRPEPTEILSILDELLATGSGDMHMSAAQQ